MSKKIQIVHSTEMVTPAMAEKWLATMIENRPLRETRVFRYARDMDAGNWLQSAQPIRFNEEGRLIDGQHRLHAVSLARKPILLEIARGVPNEAVKILDEGTPRSISDLLHFRGRGYYIDVTGAIGVVWRAATGNLFKSYSVVPSRQEVADMDGLIGQELADIASEVRAGIDRGGVRRNWLAAGQTAGFAYIFRHVNKAKADEFLYACTHWPEMPRKHPVAALQERLQREKINRTHLHAIDKAALVTRAWNAMVSGRELAKLMTRRGADGDSAWPDIAGFSVKKLPQALQVVISKGSVTIEQEKMYNKVHAKAKGQRKAAGKAAR